MPQYRSELGLGPVPAVPIIMIRPLISSPLIAVIAAYPHNNNYKECYEDCPGSGGLE